MIDGQPTAAAVAAAKLYLSIANGAIEPPRRWKGRIVLVVSLLAGAMALSFLSPPRAPSFPNLLPGIAAVAFACGLGGNSAGWLTLAGICLWGGCRDGAELMDPKYFLWFVEVGLTWASIPAVASSYDDRRRRRRRTKASIVTNVRSSSVIG